MFSHLKRLALLCCLLLLLTVPAAAGIVDDGAPFMSERIIVDEGAPFLKGPNGGVDPPRAFATCVIAGNPYMTSHVQGPGDTVTVSNGRRSVRVVFQDPIEKATCGDRDVMNGACDSDYKEGGGIGPSTCSPGTRSTNGRSASCSCAHGTIVVQLCNQ